jgi:A nuclease of the HNH/ENDO VII superfamily with conserved LHH
MVREDSNQGVGAAIVGNYVSSAYNAYAHGDLFDASSKTGEIAFDVGTIVVGGEGMVGKVGKVEVLIEEKIVFNGVEVIQDSKLINPDLVDKLGRTNLQRMEGGLAPIGPDGKSINLHHVDQTMTGSV